jgi:hypothetical protein
MLKHMDKVPTDDMIFLTVQATSQITLMNIWTCAKYKIWIKVRSNIMGKNYQKKNTGTEGGGRSKASPGCWGARGSGAWAPHWRRAGGLQGVAGEIQEDGQVAVGRRPAPTSPLVLLVPSSPGRPRTHAVVMVVAVDGPDLEKGKRGEGNWWWEMEWRGNEGSTCAGAMRWTVRPPAWSSTSGHLRWPDPWRRSADPWSTHACAHSAPPSRRGSVEKKHGCGGSISGWPFFSSSVGGGWGVGKGRPAVEEGEAGGW